MWYITNFSLFFSNIYVFCEIFQLHLQTQLLLQTLHEFPGVDARRFARNSAETVSFRKISTQGN